MTHLRNAFSFLTILPVGYTESDKRGRMMLYFPVVGLVIGLLLYAILSLQLDPELRAFLALLAWVVITGGLHLDGFADSCDGLIATTSPERRLEIMKDPRTGAWAVIGLVMLMLGKWIALREADPVQVIGVPIMGRLAMIYGMSSYPSARPNGLGAMISAGLGKWESYWAIVVPLVVLFLLVFYSSVLVGVVWIPILAAWAASRLGGGLTGDVYGALCESTELVCLVVLVL